MIKNKIKKEIIGLVKNNFKFIVKKLLKNHGESTMTYVKVNDLKITRKSLSNPILEI